MVQAAGLSDMARAVLAATIKGREVTRRQLAETVGVSFPSVTNVIADLGRAGLITEIGRNQGPRGRARLIYGVAPQAGWVLGVDIGATQVQARSVGLDGRIQSETSRAIAGRDITAATRAAADVASRVLGESGERGPLRAVALGVNQIVPKSFAAPDSESSTAGMIARTFSESAGLPAAVDLLVENNVNCAAVAEHENGLMSGCDDCAYLQIGVGIGLGFFSDGTLVRGGNGASGEIAHIPVSWFDAAELPPDELERRLGSVGLLASAASVWDGSPAPASTEDLLRLAREGHPSAVRIREQHAVALARLIVAFTAVIDPSVVVLGGGLSQDAGLAALVSDGFRRRNSRSRIEVSSKGITATVEGASLLALDHAMTDLLGDAHRPVVPSPAVWRRSEETG